jgi:hypothetical protein
MEKIFNFFFSFLKTKNEKNLISIKLENGKWCVNGRTRFEQTETEQQVLNAYLGGLAKELTFRS